MRLNPGRAKIVASALLILCSIASGAQQVQPENIPAALLGPISNARFASAYLLDGSVNPFYLRGDFDGDGKPDYALRIKSKADGTSGIAIWLSSKTQAIFLGARTPFRFASSSDLTFSGLDTWQVYSKGRVERGVEAGPAPRLIGDAILIGKSESASGLIYWNGLRFKWYQQGD